jgi:hypothetical protein
MDDEASPPPTQASQEQEFVRLLGEVDSDTRLALEKLMVWLAERPKDSEQMSEEQMEKILEEVRLENIRRRLGGKVGEILRF